MASTKTAATTELKLTGRKNTTNKKTCETDWVDQTKPDQASASPLISVTGQKTRRGWKLEILQLSLKKNQQRKKPSWYFQLDFRLDFQFAKNCCILCGSKVKSSCCRHKAACYDRTPVNQFAAIKLSSNLIQFNLHIMNCTTFLCLSGCAERALSTVANFMLYQ